MKILIITLAILMAAQVSFAGKVQYPIHLLPDQNITDFEAISALALDADVSDYVNEAVRVGKKNMDWLKHMNSIRPDDQKIALTKPGELTPIPITAPKIYSPATVERDFKELSSAVPESMKAIIFGTAPFTDNPDVDLQTYILWAKKVDKMYQTAARWLTMKPYLPFLQQNKTADIRGYYWLSKEEGLTDKLQNFSSLEKSEQDRLFPLLVNMCENRDGLSGCDSKLNKAITNNAVPKFYSTYLATSKKTFDDNFIIDGVRTDIRWTQNEPGSAYIPVRDTGNAEVNHFLEYNIEDEWKWDGWKLDLELTSNAAVHVEFEAGATPHVDGLGGNTITMDANAPLTEWDVQWTIRHEFGHVLGFPDCYVEFYDAKAKAIVNYQIDTDNMMCSRAGRMQEVHYSEMKRAYFN